MEEEKEDIVSGSQAQKEEQLKVYENFVSGMLKTFGTLALDRMQMMLSQFVEGYDLSVQELKDFLTKLVKADKLEMSGGVYKLKK